MTDLRGRTHSEYPGTCDVSSLALLFCQVLLAKFMRFFGQNVANCTLFVKISAFIQFFGKMSLINTLTQAVSQFLQCFYCFSSQKDSLLFIVIYVLSGGFCWLFTDKSPTFKGSDMARVPWSSLVSCGNFLKNNAKCYIISSPNDLIAFKFTHIA